MQPECLKSVSLRFNSWAQLRKPNTNISRLSFPVRRMWAACLHRLCYIINAVCLLIQACSLFTVSALAMRFIFCFILIFGGFFSSWPIWFAFFHSFVFLFFCLSFSSSCPSASFSYFLLTDSLIISHIAPSASLLLSHSIFSDNAGRLYTVWLLVNVLFVFIFQSWFSYAYKVGCESATCNGRTACLPSYHHSPVWQESAAKRRSPAGSPDAYCTADIQHWSPGAV